jgi:hypothetical protein
MSETGCAAIGAAVVPRSGVACEPRQISRRQILTGLAFMGAGAAGATIVSTAIEPSHGAAPHALPAAPPRTSLALRGESLRFDTIGTVPGALPAFDRPFGARGTLVSELGEVGRFEITPMPGLGGVLQLHTFEMGEGTLLGMGSAASGGAGTFAVIGGTGAYRGASGSYTARLGDGRAAPVAEFVFDLTLGA